MFHDVCLGHDILFLSMYTLMVSIICNYLENEGFLVQVLALQWLHTIKNYNDETFSEPQGRRAPPPSHTQVRWLTRRYVPPLRSSARVSAESAKRQCINK
jgi:hypothetical protein